MNKGNNKDKSMKFRTEKEQKKKTTEKFTKSIPPKSQFFEKNNKFDKLQTDKEKKRHNYKYQEGKKEPLTDHTDIKSITQKCCKFSNLYKI